MTLSSGRLVPAALLFTGLALAAAAAPRVVGHLLVSEGERHFAPRSPGETPSPAAARAAIDSRRAALGWAALPDAWIDLGGLWLALGQDRARPLRERRALLDRSIAAFRSGLALGPARPYAWTQYAQAAFERGAPAALIGRALALSMDLAPHERPLVIQRVRFGFAARDVLPALVAARVADQVRLMARFETRPLAEFARARFALAWVRAALRPDPALLDRFDLAYARLPPA